MFSSIDSVNVLTALLLKRGVRHVVVCPGSRNAPLVHNFNESRGLVCVPVTDERSAGFVALGLAQHSEEPVAVCVTSGSALLNLVPAVAEAACQHYPLIIVSADRPLYDIDRLQGQTIHQPNALAPYTSVSVSLPDSPANQEYTSLLINKALIALNAADGRPVHINIPLPNTGLYSFDVPALPDVKLVQYTSDLQTLTPTINRAKTILLVLGQLHPFDALKYAGLFSNVSLLAEPIAAEHLPYTVNDKQLQQLNAHSTEEISPDLVIYIGGNTISKLLRQTLVRVTAACDVMMVNSSLELEDVTTHASHLVQADVHSFLDYLSTVVTTNRTHPLYPTESTPYVANPVSALIASFESLVNPATDYVYYANSSAIRLAAVHARHYVFCNRGINGIEGSLSTAVGAALACPSKKVYCVTGDLSFFYDQNALWLNTSQATSRPNLDNLRILLLNSGGGQIFNTLPNATASSAFSMIAAHHKTSAEHICRQYNIQYIMYTDSSSLQEFTLSDRITILEYNICGQ